MSASVESSLISKFEELTRLPSAQRLQLSQALTEYFRLWLWCLRYIRL